MNDFQFKNRLRTIHNYLRELQKIQATKEHNLGGLKIIRYSQGIIIIELVPRISDTLDTYRFNINLDRKNSYTNFEIGIIKMLDEILPQYVEEEKKNSLPKLKLECESSNLLEAQNQFVVVNGKKYILQEYNNEQ